MRGACEAVSQTAAPVQPLILRLLLAIVLWTTLAPRASAEVGRMVFAPRLEVPLVAAGTLTWLLSEQLKPRVAPSECRTCGVNGLDRAGQRGLRWEEHYERAHRLSDWLLLGIVPVLSIGGVAAMGLHEGSARVGLLDAFIVVESLVLTSVLTQATKYAVGRARPYVRTQREEGRDFVASPDDHLSFFSGHTSATFALAVSASMTATLRGYRAAPALWAVAVPLAAFTGYLRIAADRHYVLDVFTGALVGSAVGVLVPWLHKREGQPSSAPTMSLAPPATVSLTWVH
jgi:membrane-associated phospholipid phosphatase